MSSVTAKPLPGPWEVDDENQVCGPGGVVAVVKQVPGQSMQDWDATAALIATAPMMAARIAALEQALVLAIPDLEFSIAIVGEHYRDRSEQMSRRLQLIRRISKGEVGR